MALSSATEGHVILFRKDGKNKLEGNIYKKDSTITIWNYKELNPEEAMEELSEELDE
jgi:hypothetical protein